MTWQTVSLGSNATEQLGVALGQRLRGSEVIELVGDLGSGKTTFVRGLARGAGSKDHVASPTFTISKIYQADKLDIRHFDFYRLNDAGLIAHELSEAINEPDTSVVLEWADVVKGVLPTERLTITFKNLGEAERQLQFNYPKSLAYLVDQS